MSERAPVGAEPTHYHAEYNTTVWPHPLYPCACDKTNARSFLATCPRCRPDLWREIVAEAAPKPAPQCVWWFLSKITHTWKCETNERFNEPDDFHYSRNKHSYPARYHFGPRPPCEEGKHVRRWYGNGEWYKYEKCPACHADLSVGASETPQCSVNGYAASSRPADRMQPLPASDPKPLHKDPLRFRGHLRGCHAWRWENYDRCSCYIALEDPVDPLDKAMRREEMIRDRMIKI